MTTAGNVIRALGLAPRPEGGFYKETFRDLPGDSDRAASTTIYFLPRAGEASRWHHVDAAAIWPWYASGLLDLAIAGGDSGVVTLVQGQRPEKARRGQRECRRGGWPLIRSPTVAFFRWFFMRSCRRDQWFVTATSTNRLPQAAHVYVSGDPRTQRSASSSR
jgi:uncharacterized protein